MCYNISLKVHKKDLEEYYRRVSGEDADFKPIYSVSGFVHPNMPVILSESNQQISRSRWGLMPFWTKSPFDAAKYAKNNLNARGDTVFDLPSFRASIRKKRCIVPVTGFFEWMDVSRNKYPHHIYLKERTIFSLAGIYDNWLDKESGELKCSFSIITTDANPLMAKIHNTKLRMPVILNEQGENEWLNPDLDEPGIKKLLKPFDENLMEAHTISKRITSRKENSNAPETLERFDYPELAML